MAFDLTIDWPAVTVTSPDTLPADTVNSVYSQTLTATGGDGSNYSWLLTGGTLPAGLSLGTDGVISGTPTGTDTATVTVQATSGGQSASKDITVIINWPPVSITTTSPLPDGTRNVVYSTTLVAAGGDGSYSWTQTGGTLPAGLSLSAAGVLSGTPTSPGQTTFTLPVSSAGYSASRQYTLQILP